MDEIEIITTSDGSHTLRNTRLNETYHSIHGAVQESMHVFIRNGLQHFHHATQATTISILEVGFGTGLNALLTLDYAGSHDVRIRYHTLEPFPLPEDIWRNLNYGEAIRPDFKAIHQAPWEREVAVTPEFTLLKQSAALQDVVIEERYDVVYFDAFAPSVQPELWRLDVLEKVAGRLRERGVFVTYSAKGQLKRDLRSLGLSVETLPGPPGKMEMVRAV